LTVSRRRAHAPCQRNRAAAAQSQLATRPTAGLLSSLQPSNKDSNAARQLAEADEAVAVQASLAHLEVRPRQETAAHARTTADRRNVCRLGVVEALQNQLAAAACVRSPHEYLQWLQVYVRRLCRENATARLRDVLDDLRGPLGRSTDGTEWNPSVAVRWRRPSSCLRCAAVLTGHGIMEVLNCGTQGMPKRRLLPLVLDDLRTLRLLALGPSATALAPNQRKTDRIHPVAAAGGAGAVAAQIAEEYQLALQTLNNNALH